MNDLPNPSPFLKVFQTWEMIKPFTVLKTSPNYLAHYHDAGRIPRNIVAMGDSVVAFSPTFAQGTILLVYLYLKYNVFFCFFFFRNDECSIPCGRLGQLAQNGTLNFCKCDVSEGGLPHLALLLGLR
jgi:hypothetical protein